MHTFVVNAQRIFSTSYTMDDGLAANRVYSILQDSCGFMWFGTDDGLSRFDGIKFKNYYLSEYINATTSNSVKKIFIDRRGKMWIGLDSGWQFTKGNNNHLSYANLPAGEYVLRIKGTNSDKIWSSNEIQLKIKVLPPFLQSQLAYIIYAIILLIILLLTVWYYIKRTEKWQKARMKRLNDEKEKELYNAKIDFFTNIAHEIRTPLSLIIGPLEYLMKTTSINNVYGEYLSIIEQNYKRLYALVTQLLDFRKVDSGAYKLSYDSYQVKDTIARVTCIFELSTRQKKISIDTSSISEKLTMVTDEEAFTKIISNLLSNALKYAKSGVAISVHFPKQAAISAAPPMKRVEDTIIAEISTEEGEPDNILPDDDRG